MIDAQTAEPLTVAAVWDRFAASAADAEQLRDFAAAILAEALAGDACARELIEGTCGVVF